MLQAEQEDAGEWYKVRTLFQQIGYEIVQGKNKRRGTKRKTNSYVTPQRWHLSQIDLHEIH